MMADIPLTGVLVVAAIAFTVPLALGLAPKLHLPSVVLEIVAGIVIGPAILGLVEVDLPLQVLALLGLAFLLFLAGLEIDTTLTPPGTQYGATQSNPQKRKRLRHAVLANPWQTPATL